jgi:hypothetical protein
VTKAKQRFPRRSGIGQTVGLIVEGDTEFEALPLLHKRTLVARCPPLKATNMGGIGSQLTSAAIAVMLAPKVIAHLAAGRSKIVVCIDREDRSDCASEFATSIAPALGNELAKKGKSAMSLDIVIADRAFEAWLLADACGLQARGLLRTAPTFKCFEGQLGEQGKKGMVELGKMLGRPYSKRRDGPMLFSRLDFDAARRFAASGHGSKSLDKLLRTLGI